MKKNDRPILFSQDMVRAIIDGRKTQTRRVIKDFVVYDNNKFKSLIRRCPYGQVGDRLWVRETWARMFKNGEYCIKEDEVNPDRCPCPGCYIEYKADTGHPYPGDWDADEAKGNDDAPKWHPSIHMTRQDSRITLEITNIRVEKLQTISEEGAKKEGCISEIGEGCAFYPAKLAFEFLWNIIHSKIFPWESNPWVWVIEFKRDNTNGQAKE